MTIMPLDSIQIRFKSQNEDCVVYKLCNRIIYTNQKINALNAFELKRQQSPTLKQDNNNAIDTAESKLMFTGNSWLAGKNRALTCFRAKTGFVIEVPEIANFFIDDDQSGICVLDSKSDKVNNAVFEEILLGPPLMLTLALNQLFALHASAVSVNNKAVLFVGESGFGKSTLAGWLNETTPLTRLADDISILDYENETFRLLPAFAQMKLADHQQHTDIPFTELGAIILLNRLTETTIKLSQLDPLNAIQVLVNHSVATQLFDKPLAQQHLAFMSELTQNLPIYTLNYPNGQEHTQTITEILTKQIN